MWRGIGWNKVSDGGFCKEDWMKGGCGSNGEYWKV